MHADNANRGGGCGRGDRGRNSNRITPDNTTFACQVIIKYCWIHSGCIPISGDCTSKEPGHNDTAIMKNLFGGSNVICKLSQKLRQETQLANEDILINKHFVYKKYLKSKNSKLLQTTRIEEEVIIAKGNSAASGYQIGYYIGLK